MSKWAREKLGDVATIDRATVNPRNLPESTYYLGLEHIARGGEIIASSTVGDAQLSSNKFHFDTRHILYGKLRPNLVKVANPTRHGVCSTDILPVLPGERLTRHYLLHYLRQPSMVSLASSRASGANLPRLSPAELLSFTVPLPPIEEQRRIASILDEADAIRAKRRTQLSHLDKLPLELFHQRFANTNNTHPTIPLSDIARWSSGKFLPASKQAGGDVPVYGGNGITGTHDRAMHKPRRLIVGRVGANCGAVHVTRPNSWVTDNALVAEILRPDVDISYLEYALRSADLNQYSAQSGQPSINGARISGVPIRLPPLEAQESFADALREIRAERDRVAKALEADEELFAALQHRAFRGEL
ncbi:restriction endonuclease subunit S [Brachybacterium massiliense]|uniref:restriction endonuclease subunit S n=1 Tax=Brachybacterium massiliense TaxID=1755098 RepID=UPI000B3BC109|nr:restriction endonuclease subunit S [Brachybacterium massiliense]